MPRSKGTNTQRLDKIEETLDKLTNLIVSIVEKKEETPSTPVFAPPLTNRQSTFYNSFVDTFSESQDDLKGNNPQLAKLYGKHQRTQSRPAFKKVKAKCIKCGKEEFVSPKLIPPKVGEDQPGYKCNGCCRG